jgi:hypothetical protein
MLNTVINLRGRSAAAVVCGVLLAACFAWATVALGSASAA